MSHLKGGLSLQSGLSVLVFHHTVVELLLTHTCAGQSQLIGPPQPTVATVGDDVILLCHLEPAVDAVGITVEWTRPDLDQRIVLLWHHGWEHEHKKHPSYEGRTSLSLGKLTQGDVSLKLSKVKLSDEGKYRCSIPSLGKESIADLVVGAASSLAITVSKNSSGVVLECESKGWYPEPELFWLDAEGKLLSAGAPETVRGPDGLYTVSSRVTVEKSHSNSFTCRVQQLSINQSRDTHIYFSDDFFVDTRDSPALIAIVFPVIFVFSYSQFAQVNWTSSDLKEQW
ncbi:butyrophilin subfamily 3 member A2-like [Myripristis murdjan]|uniref:butyrophilin subfamily 3 member A2-like n=1 Tax=Myripristis murdjan TaxID=586833 RepID=UPI001175DDC1|nr:butyrophilin subfamily 3 member A2-like [Myripristis murdjan]